MGSIGIHLDHLEHLDHLYHDHLDHLDNLHHLDYIDDLKEVRRYMESVISGSELRATKKQTVFNVSRFSVSNIDFWVSLVGS